MKTDFVSIPVKVKAIQFVGTNWDEVIKMIELNGGEARMVYLDQHGQPTKDITSHKMMVFKGAGGAPTFQAHGDQKPFIVLNGDQGSMFPYGEEEFQQFHAPEMGEISDGFHTFNQLYTHRIMLYKALCKQLHKNHNVWKSQTHSDGSKWDGWFIMGINTVEGEQISYHLPMKEWENCHFAETLDAAPKFDSHTPEDVLERINKFFV